MADTLTSIASPRDLRSPQASFRPIDPVQLRMHIPKIVRVGLVASLFVLVFMPRFSLNIGHYVGNSGLIAQFLLIGTLLLANVLRIEPVRASIFLACLAIMFLAWVLNPAGSSFLSALLLMAEYLVFIFIMKLPDGNEAVTRYAMIVFGNFMLVAAVFGILQFFMQFAYKPAWLFDYTPYIPTVFRSVGTYNTVISAGSFIKSNGFFFREPSTCSQFLALALLCEISMNRRRIKKLSLPRMATLGFALLLTYSGTGLATLFIGMMFPFGLKTAVRMGLIGIGAAVLFWGLGSALNLSFTANRVNEFNNQGTSAYARYVAPVIFIQNHMDSHSISFLVGHGPGSVTRSVEHRTDYENADPTWAKLLFEYGVFGFVAFVGLMLFVTARSRAPAELIAAFCAGWFIIWGGVFLAPEVTSLIFVLSAVAAAVGPADNRPPARLTVDVGQLTAPGRRPVTAGGGPRRRV